MAKKAKNSQGARKDPRKKQSSGSSAKKQKGSAKSSKKLTPIFKVHDGHWKWIGLFLLLMSLVSVLAFAPSFDNEFTNWDDHKYVHENIMLGSDFWERQGWSTNEAIRQIGTTPVAANHHPLTMWSLAWNYNNFQPRFEKGPNAGNIDLQPKPFIITNLVLHLLCAFIAFFFLYFLTGGNLIIPMVAASAFSIHPMHVESVAWIAARKDSLFTLFFFGGLLSYLKVYEKGKLNVPWYVVTLLLFVLSCAAKPAATVFPLVLLLIDYFKGRIGNFKDLFKEGLVKIPFFAGSVAEGVITLQTQRDFGAVGETEIYSLFQKTLFASASLVRYFYKFFVPHELSTFYAYPPLGNIPTFYYVAPFVVLASIALVYLAFRKNKYVMFALLFFFINLILVLQFLSVGNAVMAERYTYVPYLGLGFLVGYILDRLLKANSTKALGMGALVVCFLGAGLFVMATRKQADVWQNSGSLWSQVLERNPNDFTASYNRGLYFSKVASAVKEDKDERERLFRIALADYEHACRLRPKSFRAHVNRGTVFRSLGELDQAVADFSKAIDLNLKEPSPLSNPDWRLGFSNRAAVYFMQKKYEDAVKDLNYLYEKTNDLKVLQNRANNLLYAARESRKAGKEKRARKHYNQAISDYSLILQTQPGNSECIYNRSVAYGDIGQYALAIEDAEKAKELGRAVSESYFNWLRSRL